MFIYSFVNTPHASRLHFIFRTLKQIRVLGSQTEFIAEIHDSWEEITRFYSIRLNCSKVARVISASFEVNLKKFRARHVVFNFVLFFSLTESRSMRLPYVSCPKIFERDCTSLRSSVRWISTRVDTNSTISRVSNVNCLKICRRRFNNLAKIMAFGDNRGVGCRASIIIRFE